MDDIQRESQSGQSTSVKKRPLWSKDFTNRGIREHLDLLEAKIDVIGQIVTMISSAQASLLLGHSDLHALHQQLHDMVDEALYEDDPGNPAVTCTRHRDPVTGKPIGE